MKLKSLAALIFRILGALFALSGFGEALGETLKNGRIGSIMTAASGLFVGILMIYFSKKLADLFCRGLTDD